MSILKNDNFDYLSDDLFGDDDDEVNKSNTEDNTQQTQDLSYSSQRFEDRRKLYESFMADPAIPTSQKNAMGFWKSLYKPTYTTQKLFKVLEERKLLGTHKMPIKRQTSKIRRKAMLNEDFGYDGTFFAPTKVLIEEQRKREDMPRAIKNIYDQKGIVNASQIYNIEQKLTLDSDDSDVDMNSSITLNNKAGSVDRVNNDLNKSLLELSRTVSEQYEISQIMKDIQNINELEVSLTELTEKIQYSSKAEQLINHTISCSQRLKIYDDICTNNMSINTCDILPDDDVKKSSQESDCDIFKNPASQKMPNRSDINDNCDENNREFVPKEVMFSFASGKAINVDSKSVMMFRTIFDNEEKKIQAEEESEIFKNSLEKAPLQTDNNLQKNEGTVVKNVGFVFASGKSALISSSKLQAFEQKFRDEEVKMKQLDVESVASNFDISKNDKENDVNAQNSPQMSPKKSSQESLKSQEVKESKLKSRTLQRLKGESSGLRRVKSKSLLGLKPKKVKYDESVIDKTIQTVNVADSIMEVEQKVTIKSVPMQVGFTFASGKNIKISDVSVKKFKNIFETVEKNMDLLEYLKEPNNIEVVDKIKEPTNFERLEKVKEPKNISAIEVSKEPENMENLQNFKETEILEVLQNVKEPTQLGFTFASGKNIAISSTTIDKFKNIFEAEERNIDLMENLKLPVPQQQNCGFVFASGKTANIDQNKFLSVQKRFMEEEEKLKSMDADFKDPDIEKIAELDMFDENKDISFGTVDEIARIEADLTDSYNKQKEMENSLQKCITCKQNQESFNCFTGSTVLIPRSDENLGTAVISNDNSTKNLQKIPGRKNYSNGNSNISNKLPDKTIINSSNINGHQQNIHISNETVTGSINHSTGNNVVSGSRNNSVIQEKDVGNSKFSNGSQQKVTESVNHSTGNINHSTVSQQKVTGSVNPSTRNKIIGSDFSTVIHETVTENKNVSTENQRKVIRSRNNSTGSQRNLFGNSTISKDQKSENEFKHRKSSENDSQIEVEDITLASQYRLSIDVYQSSSEDENFNTSKLKILSSRTRKSARNLKKPNFDIRTSSNDIKNSSTRQNILQQKDNNNVQPSSKSAFILASGKNVDISQSKLINAKKNFVMEVDENDISIPFQPSTEKSQLPKYEDTQMSSKSSLKQSDSSMSSHRLSSLRGKRKHDDESDIFNFESSFTLKSKKTSQTPTATITKAQDSGIESQEKSVNKVESPQMLFKKSTFFSPMFTSSPVVNPSSTKSRQKISKFNRKWSESSSIDPLESIKRKFMPSVDKKDEILDKEFGELVVFKPTAAKRLAMDNEDEIMISPIIKDKKRPRRSYDTPISAKIARKSENFKKQTLSQRMAEIDEFMDLQSQLNLIGNDPTESQVVSILEIEQQHLSRFETENKVKSDRMEAIKEQIEYVNNKPEDESRQMTGTMFMMKCGKRRNLKDYVENEQPHDKNIHEMTFNDVMNFKFDMRNYIVDAWSKVSIIVADNAKLVLDEMSNVGFNEILYSFLASYGVDPKLVKHDWVENAYKMILMKFIWMENSFDKIEKFEVLTPENVLLQLKYRYDREIDRHQRPALRKITERDEVPNRRIVLKVIDIIYSLNVGYELDLSDGWYKIRACVDSCLAEAISRKKIVINTKLIICNSELINMFTSAYHPLELPPGVRLKIHGNSTRIVGYEMKLGFCKHPQSFLISVDSISSDGGVIGRLKLFITHVYTMIYVESNGEKKEFRSEKMQNRLENKKEILYSTMFEKIQKQIMQENYNELKERVGKIDRSRIVLSKMSIQEICDILEYESESDLAYAIKSQLTSKQVEKIQEIHHQRKFELNQKIKERINQNENSVAQLLKFRVVDANNPKKTALVSWWQPSEELLNIIKQGNTIELFKTSSAGKFQAMCGGEIQIHADKSTVVKLLKTGNDDRKFDEFIRKETRFEDVNHVFNPLNNEFDVACMIVHVDEKLNDGKLQRVYVADERLNFMSLNFYPSLNEYAYDDVLIEGKILYIRNLQWRKMFKHNNFPEAHAVIDSTIFISNPKDESQQRRLEEFMNCIEDVGNHLERCREKLESFIGKIPPKSASMIVNVPVNFKTPSPLVTSRKRVLGMKRIPQKYRFS